MPRALTDIRIAHSFIGNNSAGSTETVELDFDIGLREAIEIFAVFGSLQEGAAPVSAAGTVEIGAQSLHLEDGTITAPESIPSEADRFDVDDEVIYQQIKYTRYTVDDTAGNAAIMSILNPSTLITFPAPILSVINLTHRVQAGTGNTYGGNVDIHYRYVSLTSDEVAFQYARRRR